MRVGAPELKPFDTRRGVSKKELLHSETILNRTITGENGDKEGLLIIRTYNQPKEIDQMTDANIIDEKARYIYETHREEWEKLYRGKIIAIDVEENDLASVGEHISDVDLEARKNRPGHRLFMRRVGKNPATVRLMKYA